MDVKYLVVAFALFLFAPYAFAGVSVSLDMPPAALFGGEVVESSLSVFNDSPSGANVALEALVSNGSGDTNGFAVSFGEHSFYLGAGQSKEVAVFFSASRGIAPEEYSVTVVATAEFEGGKKTPREPESQPFFGLLRLGSKEVVQEPDEPEPKPVGGSAPGKPLRPDEINSDYNRIVEVPIEPPTEPENNWTIWIFIFALIFLGLAILLKKRIKQKKEEMKNG